MFSSSKALRAIEKREMIVHVYWPQLFTFIGHNSWWHMKHAAHDPNQKDGIIQTSLMAVIEKKTGPAHMV